MLLVLRKGLVLCRASPGSTTGDEASRRQYRNVKQTVAALALSCGEIKICSIKRHPSSRYGGGQLFDDDGRYPSASGMIVEPF